MYARMMAARRQSAPVNIDSTDNVTLFIAERRERSEANNRVLFEIPRYLYIYIYIYVCLHVHCTRPCTPYASPITSRMWVMSTNVYISVNPAVSAHSLAFPWRRT